MKTARVMVDGVSRTIDSDLDPCLADPRVVWLPPVEPRTIFAVGLNYRDHARELDLKTREEPVVFLKGPNSVAGHLSRTRRPRQVQFMHYECELAVIIGEQARSVSRADALRCVAGYTVANDYAIRDYLENYYRPNLRAKNHDAATILGPWLVDADDISDPQALRLTTTVNGRVMQDSSTAEMIYGVAALVEFLSSFMTLAPRDIILTGTPHGVSNVNVGDEVITEIEGVGRLVNHIVEEAEVAPGLK